jgi:hypothetical protein
MTATPNAPLGSAMPYMILFAMLLVLGLVATCFLA